MPQNGHSFNSLIFYLNFRWTNKAFEIGTLFCLFVFYNARLVQHAGIANWKSAGVHIKVIAVRTIFFIHHYPLTGDIAHRQALGRRRRPGLNFLVQLGFAHNLCCFDLAFNFSHFFRRQIVFGKFSVHRR